MDSDHRLDELVAPLRDDVTSGASLLSRTAADVIRRAAVRLQVGSIEELRWGLGEVSRRVLDAQPAMAPLAALVRDVLRAVEQADTLERGRHAAASAADHFRSDLEARSEAAARAAASVLPVGGMVATLSSSATVRRLLVEEAGPRGVTVLCFESRPVNEGREMASALARAGVDVVFAVDAATHLLIPEADVVLIGADSIGDLGVVNKIGSSVLAHAAHVAGVPVHVLADETKILPRGFPQVLDDDRPGREVWDAPAGVRVWNRYFEVVPLAWITSVVTDLGIQTPHALEDRRGELDFPIGLRAWAASRRPE
jgi:translation initiation factor 2B subunit (eIF-2B alpha/beta/delta family)